MHKATGLAIAYPPTFKQPQHKHTPPSSQFLRTAARQLLSHTHPLTHTNTHVTFAIAARRSETCAAFDFHVANAAMRMIREDNFHRRAILHIFCAINLWSVAFSFHLCSAWTRSWRCSCATTRLIVARCRLLSLRHCGVCVCVCVCVCSCVCVFVCLCVCVCLCLCVCINSCVCVY